MPAANQEVTAVYTWVAGGLVSRFTFDIDARDTCGTSDGTLTNGAGVTTDATRGKVLSLDGDNDYVSLPSGAMAAGRSELTLSMWVNPDTWASGDTIYDEYAESNYWQFTLIYGAYYTRDSSTGTTGSRNNDLTLPALSTGQWTHIAATYSTTAGEKELYVDGVLEASSTTSIDTLTSTRDGVGIGYACDGNNFDGLVDDVRLYNTALNLTELALLAEKTLYTLTVNSGSGDGDYGSSQVIDISADSAPSGYEFDDWIGDTSGIANVSSSSTTLTMPASNATITATYEPTGATYTLTVNSGSGDGSYAPNQVVDITADAAPSGYEFDEWIGDTGGIADVDDPTTTLTMPAANQEITATYSQLTLYSLTVNSGSGDGNYQEDWVVNITADAAPSGKVFDEWTGDVSGIANVNASSTTLTMPAANQTITATYEDAGAGPSISSTTGTWAHGNTITISGSGFGTKSTAAPRVWDDFEDGSNTQSIDGQPPVVGPDWGTHTSHGTPPKYSNISNRTNSSLCSRHDFAVTGQYNCSLEYYEVTDTAYFTFWWKYDLQGSTFNRNTKPWIEYGTEGYFPLLYTGFGNPDYGDGSLRVSIQDDPMPSGPGDWGGTNLSSIENEWIRIEDWHVQSDPNVSNGTFQTWVHRPYAGSPSIVLDLNLTSRMMRTGSSQWRQWHFGSYFARDVDPYGGGGPVDGYIYTDDIYFDVTRARVEVGNASTWAGCTQREIQIPSAWSGSSITITANKGSFSSFSGKYLYVVDSSGNVSSGYGL